MKSHGDGKFSKKDFAKVGNHVVFEPHVLVFHPENIEIGDNVYIGHQTILKGYHKQKMIISEGTWIGQQCFFHSAGGLFIGKNVGIGPGVKIITSFHRGIPRGKPILHTKILFNKVIIEDDCDVGVGSTILPGVKIGRGALIGAGSVVTREIPSGVVAYGSPAKVVRIRQ
jgi:acetyltransferase-like isoleucine patch superfamily enzyme